MIKPKVALVKDGFLPAGSENTRGRLSGAAIARCKELAAQGWQIEGYVVSSNAGSESVVDKVKVATGAKVVGEYRDPIRHEDAFQAYTSTGEVGMREVCNNCGQSLTYCPCPHPVVNLSHEATGVVVFKPRTVPLPAKRW